MVLPEVRKVYFDSPGKQEKVWGVQSKWTEGRTSELIRKFDGIKMFVGPKEDFEKRSMTTLRVMGISQNKSRSEIFEDLERMSGTEGMIQALYVRLVSEEDSFTRYEGTGFVHVMSAEVAQAMVSHLGVDSGTRFLRCDYSYWEFDLEAAAREMDTEVYGFGGPRFSFSGERKVFLDGEQEWNVQPMDWKMNEQFTKDSGWMRYLGKPEWVDWKKTGAIPIEDSEEESMRLEQRELAAAGGTTPFMGTLPALSEGSTTYQNEVS